LKIMLTKSGLQITETKNSDEERIE
jgi:hypothetical protein